jgi:pyruvate/2-oxoglutarate dehydrogenase complex dihydrolipoamide acyltransferase (E2) component
MNYEMKMPDLATTGAAIKIVRWLVEPGQPVKRGQFILEIETDKATMEVECAVDEVFGAARVAPGAEANTGDVIAVLDVAGSGPATPAPAPAPAATPPFCR